MLLLLLLQVTVMTYNLRFDTELDGVNRWDNRKEHVAALIRHEEPHFLGTQEGLRHQLEYLTERLPAYAFIGVGRDDGADAGEFSALFYDTRRVELIPGSGRTRWFSPTPDQPSKSWDAALPRVVTFGSFRVTATGDTLHVFNTHFDHVGQIAREESAKLLLSWMEDVAGDDPFVLMGDFNVIETNPVYDILTSSPGHLRDAYHASENPHVGPTFTFEGFEVRNSPEARRIDFVFVPATVRVTHHAILSMFRDGRYPSDHLPVVAKIRWAVSASPLR